MLADEPAMQAYLSDQVMTVANDNLKTPELAIELFNGIADSQQFSDLFEHVVRSGHVQMIAAVQGDSNAVIDIEAHAIIGVELDPTVAEAKNDLIDQGIAIANRIPEVDRTIIIASAEAAPPAQTAEAFTTVLGVWLSWAVPLFLAAWLTGPFRMPCRIRAVRTSAASAIRSGGEQHSLTTGSVGEWLYRIRVPLYVLIALGAAAVLIFNRPLTLAVILWSTVIALLLVAVLQVLRRPPDKEMS